MTRPMTRSTCHPLPRSRYSHPWLPNQNHALPIGWRMPNISPKKLPKMTSARAAKRMLIHVAWPFGSRSPSEDARKSPPATHAVDIHRMASGNTLGYPILQLSEVSIKDNVVVLDIEMNRASLSCYQNDLFLPAMRVPQFIVNVRSLCANVLSPSTSIRERPSSLAFLPSVVDT